MKKKDTQSNKFQITINNPLEYGYTHEKIKELLITDFSTITYFCMADEQGTTYHTHIFACFTSKVRFSKVKKSFPEAHIETAKGNVTSNINYIKKEGKWENDEKHGTKIEGTFEDWGERPPDSSGKRGDMSQLYNMINAGKSNTEIISENQDFIKDIDKLDKLRTMLLIDENRGKRRDDIKVIYIFGPTGTGKTRYVYDTFTDQNVYRVTDYLHPFDGYCGENVVCFDEFRSSFSISDCLNYLDIYPIQLPARYANKFACYHIVIIISNEPLEEQYVNIQKEKPHSWDAFLRRIHEVREFRGNSIKVYSSTEEYFNRNNKETEFTQLTLEDEKIISQTFESEV